jgi:hypothetical protein
MPFEVVAAPNEVESLKADQLQCRSSQGTEINSARKMTTGAIKTGSRQTKQATDSIGAGQRRTPTYAIETEKGKQASEHIGITTLQKRRRVRRAVGYR